MDKCARCDRRKARRRCPALGSEICSLCCGSIREKDVRCPPGCEHLAQHAPYQEQRVLERREGASAPAGARREGPPDERSAWLLFTIEATLHEIAARNPGFADRDALLACDYARDKLAKGERRLILPGESLRGGDAAGEALAAAASRCRFQRTALISDTEAPYAVGEQTAAFDVVIRTIRAIAGDRWEGRTFLSRLEERFGRMRGRGGSSNLITPA
jgi:hypothetical protein